MVNSNKKKRKNNSKNKMKISDPTTQTHKDKEEQVESLDENVHVQFEPQGNKRTFPTEDSDTEDKPKKKKKKKQLVPNSTTDKKGEKSIRQMKREKHAQRQAEAAAASKDQLKSECLTYLSKWKHDRNSWKFMKIKQVWLHKNKFSSTLLPDSSWSVFLEYFESAKGNIKNMLLEDANKVIKEMDEWTEFQNNIQGNSKTNEGDGQECENEPKKPDDTAYKRARDLIQCLQE